MLPLFLNVTGQLGVVVGGGPVGRRKASTLLRLAGRVRLVCLENQPEDFQFPLLEWLTGPYQERHLEGAALVFAAATPEVNHQVTADANRLRLWINVATDPQAGDFFMPATIRRGDFTIAIGTAGAAPALAREVRRRLEAEYDDAFGRWVEVLAWLRPRVKSQVADPSLRRLVWNRLCQGEWLERLRQEELEGVRAAMLEEIRKMASEIE